MSQSREVKLREYESVVRFSEGGGDGGGDNDDGGDGLPEKPGYGGAEIGALVGMLACVYPAGITAVKTGELIDKIYPHQEGVITLSGDRPVVEKGLADEIYIGGAQAGAGISVVVTAIAMGAFLGYQAEKILKRRKGSN